MPDEKRIVAGLPFDISTLVLRVIVGIIFLPHGYSKVFGAGGASAFAADVPQYGLPAALGYVAAYAEFFGALLLIFGLLTRLNAFLLFSVMLGALVLVHGPEARFIEGEGVSRLLSIIKEVELPLSLAASTLALMFLGPGRFSLDRLFGIEERLAAALPRISR